MSDIVKAADDLGAAEWQAQAQAHRIVDLLEGYSVETVPADEAVVTALAAFLPRGSSVYVAAPPARGQNEILATARALMQAGLQPVPHIAARTFADRDRLANILWRLRSAADVDQVLLVGGNVKRPVGEFATALDVLESGLFQEFGIKRVGITGYPEGHPEIGDALLVDSLSRKLAYGRDHGLDMHVVTQFCFDARAVTEWLGRMRPVLGSVPVRIGVPGVSSLPGLVKFARLCKIGSSVQTLTRGIGPAFKLATWTPDQFLTALAIYRSVNPACGIDGVHFFSFGGAAKTARWVAAVAGGNFTMRRDDSGFTVDR